MNGLLQGADVLLSRSSLFKTVRDCFDKIKLDKATIRGRKAIISLTDCLMAALAMFSLKSPSLLAFDHECRENLVSINLKTLFNIENTPSDTHMRDMLDEVDSSEIRPVYIKLFDEAKKTGLIKSFELLKDDLIVALDGTSIYESEKINCDNCCTKKRRDGSIRYCHQILSAAIVCPGKPQVLPFYPEAITKQDGEEKNDCELRAAHRLLNNLKRDFPDLKCTITADALFANGPLVTLLTELGYNYIIVAKEGNNETLFKLIDTLELRKKNINKNSIKYSFRYVNNILLNNSKDAPKVNFFECKTIELTDKETKEVTFSFITSHHITEKNLFNLLLAGRARWKIENETFNTLKNQGYQFEHNFGHGKKNLHTVFAFLMMLAFLIDQIGEAADLLFQAALKKLKSRRRLWEKMRNIFYLFVVTSWEDMFKGIASGHKHLEFTSNTC